MKDLIYILKILLSIIISFTVLSCTQLVVGGSASGGIILVQERSAKQAAKDIIIKTKIEEAFFSTNYDDIFSKIKVIVFEGKVLLVETAMNDSFKSAAATIVKKINGVKEIADYISRKRKCNRLLKRY